MLDYLNPVSDKFILKTIIDYLNPFSENFILKSVIDFLGNIISYINPFSENFLLKGVLDFLSNIISYINPFSDNFLGKKIVEMIGDLLTKLFVPSEDKILALKNVVSEKFAFIDSIKIAINSLENMFNNVGSFPKYTIDIDSKYYKGELTVIDLEWYSQYKPYGDIVITAFAYLFFLFRLSADLPNILSGVGTVSDVPVNTSSGSVNFVNTNSNRLSSGSTKYLKGR